MHYHYIYLISLCVADGSDAECASQNPFPKKSPAYISSNAYYDVGVATESCPWKLEGLPGQQITLEIFDFTLSSEISRVTQGDGDIEFSQSVFILQYFILHYIMISKVVQSSHY